MVALAAAKIESNLVIADRCLLTALTKYITPAADMAYSLCKEVLVFSEFKNAWIGPFNVFHAIFQVITIKSQDGSKIQTFNSFQFKSLYKPVHHSGFFPETKSIHI